MSIQQRSGYCKACGAQVLVQRKGTNHILRLLLTLATSGVWIIVWILAGIKIGGWRCSHCGSKRVSKIR